MLTDALVAQARVRRGSELTIHDADAAGLTLRVRASGAKSWIMRTTKDGRSKRVTLGAPPALSVAQARAMARAIRAGEPLPSCKPAAPQAERFSRFAKRFRAWAAERWRPTTVSWLDSTYRLHLLPVFGATPLNDIDAPMVARWFYDLSRDRPKHANRMLATLSVMLSKAREWGQLPADAPRPCAAIRKNRIAPRGGTLSRDQLSRLGATLDRLAGSHGDESDAVRLLLLTGCRRGEVLGLRWSDVRDGRLQLRSGKTGPRAVALSAPALALLERRRAAATGKLVFPHPKDPKRPRAALQSFWRRVVAAADLPQTLRLHDLRHTYASQAIMGGETMRVGGALLGHRRMQTTERYAHLEDRHLCEAADKVSEQIAAFLGEQRRRAPS